MIDMYEEISFTSAERRRAAALVENAGYMLDFVKRAPMAFGWTISGKPVVNW